MLFPKKTKFKKAQKGKKLNTVNKVYSLNKLNYGVIGLKSLSNATLTAKQLETLQQMINKFIKRVGRLFICVFPHTPVSKKPLEIRMGKGKGNVHHWSCKIKAGTTLCEIQTSSITSGIKALKAVQSRLPFKTSIILN